MSAAPTIWKWLAVGRESRTVKCLIKIKWTEEGFLSHFIYGTLLAIAIWYQTQKSAAAVTKKTDALYG